jgi:starch phosphorylase
MESFMANIKTLEKNTFDKEAFKKNIINNCKILYRKNLDEATQQQKFQSVAYAVKDIIIDKWIASQKAYKEQDAKIVYYMSGISYG